MTDTKTKRNKQAAPSKLAAKSEAELIKSLAEKREEIRKFRFGSAGSKVKNVKTGRTLRKEVAQMLTELNARKLAAVQK